MWGPCARPAGAASAPSPGTRAKRRASCSTTCPKTQDWQEFRAGIRITREIIQQKALDPYRGREISPGVDFQSDAELDEFVRQHGETAYHPSCSCRMGNDDMAVVDGQGRVHGVEALRVIDASIMPQITTGNLNAPTIMMAEKLADVIRGREPLVRADVPYFVAGNTPARRQGALPAYRSAG